MKTLTLLAVVCLCTAAPARAQSAPCLAANDATRTTSGALSPPTTGIPNERAYLIASPGAMTIHGVRFCTGNNFAPPLATFSVRIHADAGGLPGPALAAGTWQVQPGVDWIGANLDRPLPVAAGSSFWLAFIDPGFSELPEDLTGSSATLATLATTGWIFRGTARPKFRLFCGPLDDFNVTPFGPSCMGSNGAIPSTFTNRQPRLGSAFSVEGTGFLPGAIGVLAIGYSPVVSTPLPGFLPPGCAANAEIADLIGSFATVGSGGGHFFFPVAVPNNPQFAGLFAAVQIGAFDQAFAVTLPVVTTNALQLIVY